MHFAKKNITVADPDIRVLLDQHDLFLVYFHKIERKLKDVFQKLKHDTMTHHEYTLHKDPQVYEKIDMLEQHAQKIQIIHYRHFPQEQNDIWLGFVFQWTESLFKNTHINIDIHITILSFQGFSLDVSCFDEKDRARCQEKKEQFLMDTHHLSDFSTNTIKNNRDYYNIYDILNDLNP